MSGGLKTVGLLSWHYRRILVIFSLLISKAFALHRLFISKYRVYPPSAAKHGHIPRACSMGR
jgi:hypothetical protein